MSCGYGSQHLLLRGCALCLGLTGFLAAQSSGVAPRARVLITQPIDPGKLHTLAGNTPGEANAENDRGMVADTFPMDHMLFQLRRSPEREQALQALMARQQDSSSPDFHKWLTAEEFGRSYGPALEDIETISRWLHAGGFTVNGVYPSGMVIDFSGTAGQVGTAFHSGIHRLSVNGKDHFANTSDPRIPEALAPAVAGIVSLHDFRPHSMLKRAQYTTSIYGVPLQLVVPADLATIYDLQAAFAAGYTGKGQTIAVVQDTDLYSAADWNTFRNVFGLAASYPSGSLETVHPEPAGAPANCTNPGVNPDDVEAILDAEWSSATAPDATIEVAACSDTTTFGGLIAVQNLISGSNPPPVISISYGLCEVENGAAANAAYNAAFQQAAAEGVSVFVAAGDEGAASCDRDTQAATHGIGVSGFASTPYNVAVGGTDFADTYQGTTAAYWSSTNSSDYGSAVSYIPEIPWNGSCASSLLANSNHYSVSYGSTGFCGSSTAQQDYYHAVVAGSGGPSGCATGAPAANLIVGGTCEGYAKPSWQTGVPGIPNDGVRDLPDVALFASDGIWGHAAVMCFSNIANGGEPCVGAPVNWFLVGGTSIAAPVMAGIQALVNQKMGSSQGNPNPVYYKLAASAAASSVFHSITMGDIAVNCQGAISCFGQEFEGRGLATPVTGLASANGALSTTSQTYTPAFAAASGWSFATGLGSVDGYNLILNWSTGQ
jgi:subtilase family serine protease